MINWVVFDLGDVVLKHTTAHGGLSELLSVEPGPFTDAYYLHRRDYDRHSNAAVFWTAVASSAGSAAPEPATIEELVRVDDLGWNDVDADTHRLIVDLVDAGVPLAVLSNAPSSMGRLVQAQPWAAAFREFVFSGDLGLLKPDPAIYQHLLGKLGAPADEVAFLDDRSDNIAGAIASGIHGFIFTDAAQARVDLRGIGVPISGA